MEGEDLPGTLKEIEVVAAVIISRGRYLVCQRREDAVFPLKWEFAGGKVEKGEVPFTALHRELKEELGIEIESATEILRHSHVYKDQFKVNLRFFQVDQFTGIVTNNVFRQLHWVKPKELADLEFLEANGPLIQKLISRTLSE